MHNCGHSGPCQIQKDYAKHADRDTLLPIDDPQEPPKRAVVALPAAAEVRSSQKENDAQERATVELQERSQEPAQIISSSKVNVSDGYHQQSENPEEVAQVAAKVLKPLPVIPPCKCEELKAPGLGGG